jgi:nucleotide-binding universal stress UspA family protein
VHDATFAPRSHDPSTPGTISRPILVGYDGSAPSQHALAHAAGMAHRMAQPLMLAHIRPTPACYALESAWPLPVEDPAKLLDWCAPSSTGWVDYARI